MVSVTGTTGRAIGARATGAHGGRIDDAIVRRVGERLDQAGLNGQAARLLAKPHTWAALGCLYHEIPPYTVQTAVKPALNGSGAGVVEALAPIASDLDIGKAVGAMQAHGLHTVLGGEVLPSTGRGMTAANRLLRAAVWAAKTLAAGLPLAEGHDHAVGTELEIYPSLQGPGAIEPPCFSHDRLYEAMADRLRAQGYVVTVHRNPARFHIKQNTVMYPVLVQRFHHAGRTIELTRVYGSGAMLIYLRRIKGGRYVRTRLWGGKGRTIAQSDAEAYAAVAKALGLGSADAVRALMTGDAAHYKRTDILMIKAGNAFLDPDTASGKPAGDDFCNVRVERAGPGTYRVVPLNGTLADGRAALEFHADNVSEVVEQLRAHVATDSECIQKTDEITGLSVAGIEGEFKWLYEQYCGGPLCELVTPKLRVRDYPVLETVLQALADLHVVGTTEHTQIGVHVHGNIPTKVNGRFSVAPLVNAVRAGIGYAPLLRALFPPHYNRKPFIQAMPRRLRRRVTQDGYVTDPTSVEEILCVMADFACDTPPKYSYINADNILAKLAEEMLAEGVLRVGQRYERTWHGRRYQFRVVWSKKLGGPDIRVTYQGRARSLLRVKPGMRKSTLEARGFDTPTRQTRNPDGSTTHTLDVASAMLYVRLMAARTVLDGTVPFVTAPAASQE